jgi:hypothetical protein
MGGQPNPGTPKDKRISGRGSKPGPKKGSHNKKGGGS